ncbi:acyltransferase [Desulfosarcina sp. OttesenSCG-928-A07]|nr:acyltransferase [Desulfosarcina sp. OttesenSCG-928-A07]
MENRTAERSPGLDLARTLAIAGVLCAHFSIFLTQLDISSDQLVPLYIVWGGYYGVELFFVLSGYLIGGILIRDVLPMPSPRRLTVFCMRRWLRTLPAYYTVLVCFIFYGAWKGGIPEDIWKYFVFFQNAPPEHANFFPVSWSLSIEEWSYIFILVLLFFPFGWGRPSAGNATSGTRLILKLVAGILFFLLLRIWVALTAGPVMWDDMFRKQVFLRLDAILYGMLAFAIKTYYPQLFKKVHVFKVFGLCLVLLQVVAWIYAISEPGGNLFIKSFAFSIVSALMAIALCFFDANPHVRKWCAPDTLLGRFSLWGSKLAYSLYLVHHNLFGCVAALFSSYLGNKCGVFWVGGIAVLASIALGFGLYTFIEKPGMNLRRHFVF